MTEQDSRKWQNKTAEYQKNKTAEHDRTRQQNMTEQDSRIWQSRTAEHDRTRQKMTAEHGKTRQQNMTEQLRQKNIVEEDIRIHIKELLTSSEMADSRSHASVIT